MRALVVGLGAIGQRHVRNLRAVLGDTVDIVAHRSRGLPHTLTERFEVDTDQRVETTYDIRVFPSFDEALAARPQIALVCNPTSLHVPVARALAEAGCHLLIEKPLSDSLEAVDDLIGLVERRRLVGLVGYQMRFHPCLMLLTRWLADERVGPLIAATVEVGEYLPGWHPYEDYRQSYAARRTLGGGAILTQSHELDYIRWLFGAPARVAAFGGRVSGLEIDVEDSATILMECIVGGRTVPVTLHQDYLQQPPRRTCEVVGEGGRIRIDFLQATASLTDASGCEVERPSFPDFERNHMFVDELLHFLACVGGEASPCVSIRDGAASLEVALAARQSLETGAVVSFR